MTDEPFISLVIFSEDLDGFEPVSRLGKKLAGHFSDYEIIIVGSGFRKYSQSELDGWLTQVSSVRHLELAYKVDYETAVSIGLENSIGDYVIVFNPNQDPMDVICPIIEQQSKNSGIVIGIEKNTRASIAYRLVRPLMTSLLKEVDYNIPRNATSLRCLSRAAVQAITKTKNQRQQIFVRMSNSGFPTHEYPYSTVNPEKKKFRDAVRSTLKIMVFNSTKPLHWMSMLGFSGCLFAFFIGIYGFVIRFLSYKIADGWSSIIVLMSFMFMLLFTILGILGEYLGRLLDSQSSHETYLIVKEHNSNVMLDTTRYNVRHSSKRIQ